MFATNIINLGCWVWGVGCSEIIGKTQKKSDYQRDKVAKFS
ncbi:MAG: hypothetical protein QNJ68_16340 [Microcoleaceae cyanobacterium MO_207.B10]|nr:hypothetical protein [Microcoleaceae cyanobacterium MO_207.B10]